MCFLAWVVLILNEGIIGCRTFIVLGWGYTDSENCLLGFIHCFGSFRCSWLYIQQRFGPFVHYGLFCKPFGDYGRESLPDLSKYDLIFSVTLVRVIASP